MIVADRFIDVEQGRIRARADGDPANLPLALINMAQTNLLAWDAVATTLATRFRVIRHDMRGTGASVATSLFTFDRYADDLAAVCNHFGIARAVVIGAAYGARTAMRFALRYPDRLRALVLLDVAVGAPADRLVREAGVERAQARRAAAGLTHGRIDPAWLDHHDPDRALEACRAHLGPMPWEADIARIAVPTLVATGDEDPNLPVSRGIAEAIPGARFLTIEMTGHGSPIERPDVVAALIADFVAALPEDIFR